MKINRVILIGASTGGPGHIQKIIKSIKEDFNATIVIAQHMQSSYLKSFAGQLNNNCLVEVLLSKDGLKLENRKVYVLDESYELKEQYGNLTFAKQTKPFNYSPNIDLLFNSAVPIVKKFKIMSIILTGIGNDGAKSSSYLASNGATCINESESSSIVYGMPKAAQELNPNAIQLNIDEICQKIVIF